MSDKEPAPSKVPIKVTGLPFRPPDPHLPRLRTRVSNFHITLNTNIRIDDPLTAESSLVVNLQRAANEVFGEEARFTSFVKFPKGGHWDTDHITGLSVVTGVEVGKDDAHGRRLHLHVQFKISHRSYVRLDPAKIKLEMNLRLTQLGYPHEIAYVHVTVHRPELADYIGKE